MMDSFEARRRENALRNEALIGGLGALAGETSPADASDTQPGSRRFKRILGQRQPTRSSRRIAKYQKDSASGDEENTGKRKREDEEFKIPVHYSGNDDKLEAASRKPTKSHRRYIIQTPPKSAKEPSQEVSNLMNSWTTWTPTAPAPTRDATGTFHFASHADFQPNKSPEEIIREGSFGGSYWRPYHSRKLAATITDDWRELPASWTAGLDVGALLTSATYEAGVNKYGVACGQTIEEWEAAGWIAHEHDVRGWFQWYCRFWMGRRCGDDERQVGRWRKSVGATGRWRRALLKKYVVAGVRRVGADGDDGDDGVVSPAVHQTCHHWGYEVRQEALDRYWAEGE